jgi:protein arginine N-methyltransferase 7
MKSALTEAPLHLPTARSFKVVYKRYTELKLLQDVPLCCNLLVADGLLDDQLLATGLLPAVTHALQHLTTHDAVVLPAAATVYVAAAQLAVPQTCGLDLGALDRYR